MVLARAVRKAVRVEAETRARGLPSGERSVMVPAGLVDLSEELEDDVSMDVVGFAVGWPRVESPLSLREDDNEADEAVVTLGDVMLGEEERGVRMEMLLGEDERGVRVDVGEEDPSVTGVGRPAWSLLLSFRVTILTPMPPSLRAGMNSVVAPSLSLICMRSGWLEAQQSLSTGATAVE